MSDYYIRIRDGEYFIVARLDHGVEEIHVSGLTREQAELTLKRAGRPIEYEKQQLDLGI